MRDFDISAVDGTCKKCEQYSELYTWCNLWDIPVDDGLRHIECLNAEVKEDK